MIRRSFLLAASAAGLVACRGPSSQPTRPGDDGPAPRLGVHLIDAQTPFCDGGGPYFNVLHRDDAGRDDAVRWVTLPDYGRPGGAQVEGVVVPTAATPEDLEAFFDGLPPKWRLPSGQMLRWGLHHAENETSPRWAARVLRRPEVITSKHLIRAQAENDSLWLWLDQYGAERLAMASALSVGQRFAFLVDDVIVADPLINEPIPGGQLQVTFEGFAPKDYRELEQRLISGSSEPTPEPSPTAA